MDGGRFVVNVSKLSERSRRVWHCVERHDGIIPAHADWVDGPHVSGKCGPTHLNSYGVAVDTNNTLRRTRDSPFGSHANDWSWRCAPSYVLIGFLFFGEHAATNVSLETGARGDKSSSFIDTLLCEECKDDLSMS